MVVRAGRVVVPRRAGANLAATSAGPATAVPLPNQQVQYATATQALAHTLVKKPVYLKPRPLGFCKQPVAEVLTALGQAHGVNTVCGPRKLADCIIAITFGDEPLYEQVNVLYKVLNATYKAADDVRIILGSRSYKFSG